MRGRSLGKMGLGCGEEVKERESFPKISNNIYIYIGEKKPINVASNMEVDEGNLGTKKRVSIEYAKPMLFSLTTDSQISSSWDLKIILFANGSLKTQDSQVFSFIFTLRYGSNSVYLKVLGRWVFSSGDQDVNTTQKEHILDNNSHEFHIF